MMGIKKTMTSRTWRTSSRTRKTKTQRTCWTRNMVKKDQDNEGQDQDLVQED